MKCAPQRMGKGDDSGNMPKKLYVRESELPRDNGTGLVFRSRKGTLHEIYGAYGDNVLVPPGFSAIYAIKVEIAGRAAPLYEEAGSTAAIEPAIASSTENGVKCTDGLSKEKTRNTGSAGWQRCQKNR